MFRTLPVRALAVLAAALLTVLVLAAPASAAESYAVVVSTSTTAVAFTLDPAAVVQLLLAVVLPVLVGLVTTRVTSSAAKAWLLAGLSLVTSLLVELARTITTGGIYDIGIALLAALPAFVISVATHYGLWKPSGVSATVQAVGAKHAA